MDLNLDTLKQEILDYLDKSGLAVFHSHPGGLEGLPMVTWDTERYPDYQIFLETACKIGCGTVNDGVSHSRFPVSTETAPKGSSIESASRGYICRCRF